MSDMVDSARELEDTQVALATEQAKNSLQTPREYLIVWQDDDGQQRDVLFTGTPAERIEYLESAGIDQRPFAFGYVLGFRWSTAGNDKRQQELLRSIT